MNSSLRQARDQRGEVVSLEHLGGGMVEVGIRLPHLARTALPGQFAQLRCADSFTPLLRRPFSVAWTDADVAYFVLAPSGVGTRLLAALRPGDSLSALGPLGMGFTIPESPGRALCLAGGLGCAPFPLLVRELRRRGHEVTVVNGAATNSLLYPPERFSRGDPAVAVVAVTVDGSGGRQGLVTDELPGRVTTATALYACGPNPMLAAVAGSLDASEARLALAEASLEAPMGCGYGTCLGCALPVTGAEGTTRWALCCRDGPVMGIDAVSWDELMSLPPAHVA